MKYKNCNVRNMLPIYMLLNFHNLQTRKKGHFQKLLWVDNNLLYMYHCTTSNINTFNIFGDVRNKMYNLQTRLLQFTDQKKKEKKEANWCKLNNSKTSTLKGLKCKCCFNFLTCVTYVSQFKDSTKDSGPES